jgi:deoxyribodipyrimidine photo-lyase
MIILKILGGGKLTSSSCFITSARAHLLTRKHNWPEAIVKENFFLSCYFIFTILRKWEIILTHQEAHLLPTRHEGLKRLAEFLPSAGSRYAEKRNYDFGPKKHENVSCLSAYTRYRLVSEQEIAEQVLLHHNFAASDKFISEVCWRTYWKGWLEHRPKVWSTYLDDASVLRALQSYDHNLYEKAIDARSGIECFDFWVKELKETGYLHNHARMWFASIWVHTLELPWQLGAELFLKYLIDGDPASNTLSWRWVAGLHTKGKSYLASASNIIKYTEQRFNPKSIEFASAPLQVEDSTREWQESSLPELPSKLAKSVDAFVIWPDDLSVDSLIDLELASHVAIVDPQWESLGVDMSERVLSFRAEARKDTVDRVKKNHGVSVTILRSQSDFSDWLNRSDIRTLAWYRPFVGHGLSLSERLKASLGSVELTELRRPWDNLFFPLAKRGFFNLKKSIERVFEELNVLS